MPASQDRHRHLFSSVARLTLAAGSVLVSVAGFAAAAAAAGLPPSHAAAAPNLFSVASPKQDPTEGRPTPRSTPVKPPTPTPTRTPAIRPPRMFDVTFKTDLPESDIYEDTGGMSRRPLGRTLADGTLTVKMSAGRHVVSASRIGSPYQKQQIQVGPGSTTFSFTLGSAAPTTTTEPADPSPTPVVSETPDAPGSTNGPTAAEAAAVDEVFKRYLDMTAPAPPSESDWDAVVRQTTAELDREPGVSLPRAQRLFAQGQLAYMRGTYADALVKFRAAEVEQPSLTAVHYGLGTAYLATKQPKEAFKAFQQAAKLDPKLALARKGMGDALFAQDKKKEAEKYYAEARRMGGNAAAAPSIGASPAASAPASLDALRDLVKRKRYNDALPNLIILSETQPSADVFIVLGDAYVGLKKPISAAPAYRRATELDERSALAAYSYGKLMFEQNEYAKAMDALERALALDPMGDGIDKKRAREMADRARERLIRSQ